jgi:hypothetical protein
VDTSAWGAGGSRQLDSQEAPLHSLEAVEEALYSRDELDESGPDGRASISLGL